MAWLDGWTYRKSLHIDSSSDGALTNYQKKITVNYGSGTDSGINVYTSSHCETDFSDIRFTASDGETELDYYIVEQIDSDKAVIYVEIASIPSSGGTDIYVYYGNDSVSTTSSGTDTFEIFEDFEDSTIIFDTAGTTGITFSLDTSVKVEGSSSANNDDATSIYKIMNDNSTSFDIDDYMIEGWMYIGTDGGTNQNFGPGIGLCGESGNNNGYQAIIDNRGSVNPQIREDTDNNGRTDGSSSVSTETWYLVNLYRDGNDVKSELYTEAQYYGLTPTSTTTRSPETTHQSGYAHVFAYSTSNSWWDATWVRKRADDEPAYGTWGSEESGGSSSDIKNVLFLGGAL